MGKCRHWTRTGYDRNRENDSNSMATLNDCLRCNTATHSIEATVRHGSIPAYCMKYGCDRRQPCTGLRPDSVNDVFWPYCSQPVLSQRRHPNQRSAVIDLAHRCLFPMCFRIAVLVQHF